MKVQPTNYCRQFLSVVEQGLKAPSISALDAARGCHARDLCNFSQKFMLPEGGKILDDSELRALNPSMPLTLPHSYIALEFPVKHPQSSHPMAGVTGITRSSKRIAFCHCDETHLIVTPAYVIDADGRWMFMQEARIPRLNYITETANKMRPDIKITVPNGLPVADWADEVRAVLCFLNAMGCSNISAQRIEPRKQPKKSKSALPFDSYHVLVVDTGARPSLPGAPLDINRRSPREHLRRGHIRRLQDGRAIWVNAAVVATHGGNGRITKDYLVINSQKMQQCALAA